MPASIAVRQLESDRERIISVCKKLGIIDFIEDLPNDLETYLGENGAGLSGGQKQRIAITRALYKDPDILILDEATSSLDSSSEQYVQRTIDLLTEQAKTIILIAHRLANVFKADKICVLDKRKVVEEGNHKELMAKKAEYFKLWQKQLPILNGKSLEEVHAN